MKKLTRTSRNNFITYGLVIIAFVVLTFMKNSKMLSSSMSGMLVPVCAYIVMALSLNLTVGIMGELSLGHAGFMSVGAFMGAAVAKALVETLPDGNLRLLISIVVGALAGAVFGFLIGIPVLRLKGDYLAIVTLAFGEIIKSIFGNLYMGIENGALRICMFENNLGLTDAGTIIVEGPMGIRNIKKTGTFAAGFILIMICLIVVFNFINSRSGRAVMAIRDNRIAAESVGIPIFRYKIMAFTVSAAMAGAAGALFASNYSSLVSTKFGFDTSILVLVFVVLGGQGNMLGSIISAAALTILPEALRQFSDYRMLAYAIILIAVMLITNNPSFKQLIEGIRNKSEKSEPGKEAE